MISKRWLMLAVLFLARSAMGFQFQSVASGCGVVLVWTKYVEER